MRTESREEHTARLLMRNSVYGRFGSLVRRTEMRSNFISKSICYLFGHVVIQTDPNRWVCTRCFKEGDRTGKFYYRSELFKKNKHRNKEKI